MNKHVSDLLFRIKLKIRIYHAGIYPFKENPVGLKTSSFANYD